ncbi:MAG: MFS transporter, partial [Candidatus Acidiferrales bacterium]
LQIVFDKGERDDWFGSQFITWATVIAVVCLVALVIWELKIDHPVIELRLLKERNFVISTFMMFILGLVLYGTTVLLPILLQTLMGYTAMQSGLVLLPGGLVLLLVLPLVGWLLSRFEPRWLVVFGFVIIAIGLFQLAHMNLDVSERTPIYDWIVSRAGTAFLFVPINVMAFYFVAKENTNNATGLIHLARNVGGSLGISFVTTMLDRRAQFHQARLVSNLQSKNLQYQGALNHLIHVFMSRGADAAHAAVQAQGVIYAQLQRQAMMLSFTDNFWIMAMLSLVVIPLMFIMKKIKPRKTSMAAH